MSVELFIAPAASGKTTFCLDKIQHSHQVDPLCMTQVILPEGRQAYSFRKLVAQSGGALNIHVGTFEDLYRRILESFGTFIPVAPAPLLHQIIQQVVNQQHQQGKLVHFAGLRSKPGFLLSLLDIFTELKRGLISPQRFLQSVQTASIQEQELAGLYGAYLSHLEELEYADTEGLCWLAINALEKNPTHHGYIQQLIFDGFDSFTVAQQKLIELLAPTTGELLITLPGEWGSTRPAYSRFIDSIQRLVNTLQPNIIPPAHRPHQPPALLHIERNLFEPGPASATPTGQHPLLLETRSQEGEVRETLRWIKSRVVRDKLPLQECAIFTPNPSTYNPLIGSIAREFGIPIHFYQSTALLESPPIVAFLNLLTLPTTNFKTRALLDVLRSPFFEFSLDMAEIDTLEEISRRTLVIEGQEQWDEAWERLLSSSIQENSDLDEERQLEKLPRAEEALRYQKKLRACFTLLTTPKISQTLTEWVKWTEDLLELLRFFEQIDPTRDMPAINKLREVLRSLVISEAVLMLGEIPYQDYLSILQNTINGTGLHEIPPRDVPALLAARLTDARGLRYKAVALLGFSEGLFPEVERADPFLGEDLRANLRLESKLNRQQASLFYQAITRSDQHLLITRPYLSDDGETWEPSPYWNEIKEHFQIPVKKIKPDDLTALEDAASQPELLFAAIRHTSGFPVEYSEYLHGWENLQHAAQVLMARRSHKPHGIYEGDLSNLSENLQKRYPPQKAWSASRLEAYSGCPHRFFASYALDLEPRKFPEPGLDSAQLGNIYHKLLEEAFKQSTNPSDPNTVLQTLEKVMPDILHDAPHKYAFRPSPLWDLEKEQIRLVLHATIQTLIEEDLSFSPVAFEQKFGDQSTPLMIELESGTILLHGIIDRVDQSTSGEYRVVDYKTGSSHMDKKALTDGIRLQLPIYALAVEQALRLGTVTEGFYWMIQSAKPSLMRLSTFSSESGYGPQAAILELERHLTRIIRGIRQAEFPPVPPKGGCPSYCPARQWCWRYSPGFGG